MIIKDNIKYLWFLILILTTLLEAGAKSYSSKEIVNPNIEDRRNYIFDPEHLVDFTTTSRVNNNLYQLRLRTGAEVGIIIVPSIKDETIEEFSQKVFENWGLGKSDKDSGLLLVISKDDKVARIETGYGLEGIIPDISANRIINETIIPNMKNGNISVALSNAVDNISKVLSDPEAAEEYKSNKGEAWEISEKGLDTSVLWNFIIIVIFSFFFLSVALFLYDSIRLRKKDRLHEALGWHNRKPLYKFLAFGSLGLGYLTFLLAERKRKRCRKKPIKCLCCGSGMEKLNEEEDNYLLSPSQDLEEQLGSVDYDVWVCPKCSAVERYPFRSHQTRYSECPNCHTIALELVNDHTVVPATTHRGGIGEKVYECRYCHNQKRDRYNIPRKDNGIAAAAAMGAIGGMTRGGGHGGLGGGIGGGFGGGRSGGGGATGRW